MQVIPTAIVQSLFENNSPFKGAPPEAIELLIKLAKYKEFKSKNFLFESGQSSLGFWGVLEGKVRLSKVNNNGELHIIKDFCQGDWLGFISYLSETNSPHDAIAIEKTKVLFLDNAALEELYETYPVFYKSTMAIISKAFVRLASHYNNTCNQPLQSRVASVLCRINSFHPEKPIELSHAELAAFVGASREAVSSALKVIENKGAISLKYKRIEIEQMQTLKSIAKVK